MVHLTKGRRSMPDYSVPGGLAPIHFRAFEAFPGLLEHLRALQAQELPTPNPRHIQTRVC